MQLTFLLRAPCGLCGYRLEGITVGSYRVNKHSLVTTSPSISFMQRDCIECGWRNEITARIAESALDAESKQRFNVYRDRKGWARAA
jgi:hypothetical protein